MILLSLYAAWDNYATWKRSGSKGALIGVPFMILNLIIGVVALLHFLGLFG